MCFAFPFTLPSIFPRPPSDLAPALILWHVRRRIWIGPDNIAGGTNPVSSVMIYAAAFHIFHCFQVFGSICKIKFVMRPHRPLPLRHPLDANPASLRAQPESRRICPTDQFSSSVAISQIFSHHRRSRRKDRDRFVDSILLVSSSSRF